MKRITLILAAAAFMLASTYAAADAAEQGQGRSKVLICHRTLSETNPYRLISISESALPAHLRHGDVLPGQFGGPWHASTCPTQTTESTGTNETSPTRGQQGQQSGDSNGNGKGKK